MAKTALPSPEVLRQLLRYDPETGNLFWLPRPVEMFQDGYHKRESYWSSWNRKFSGKQAFTILSPLGYRKGTIFDRKFMAHRVIWAMQTGAWPKVEIDHIDGNPSNNVWGNLREATRSENQRNTGLRSNNTSGFRGVWWNARRKKWAASIRHFGKTTHLGTYDVITEAVAAYAAASARIHGSFARLGQNPIQGTTSMVPTPSSSTSSVSGIAK